MHTDTPPIVVNAVPVRLEGILKESEPPVAKRTFAEEKCHWPLPWPCGVAHAPSAMVLFFLFLFLPLFFAFCYVWPG